MVWMMLMFLVVVSGSGVAGSDSGVVFELWFPILEL